MDRDDFTAKVCCYTDAANTTDIARHYYAFCKTNDDVDVYIQSRLPLYDDVRLCDVLAPFGQPDAQAVDMAKRWMQQQKYQVRDTLLGFCVANVEADKLRDFLSLAIPVCQTFQSYCQEIELAYAPALYANYLLTIQHGIIKTNYHPYSHESVFWTEGRDKLIDSMEIWSARYFAEQPSCLAGYLSIADAAEMAGVEMDKMLDWLDTHRDCCINHNGRWLSKEQKIKDICEQWKRVSSVSSLLPMLLESIPVGRRKGAKQEALRICAAGQQWLVEANKYPQQDCREYYISNKELATEKIRAIIEHIPVLPLCVLQQCTGFDLPHLRTKVEEGQITAQADGNGYLITIAEQKRVQAIANSYMTLDEVVNQVKHKSVSFAITDYRARDNLVRFGQGNDWWGLDMVSCDDLPLHGGKFGLLVDSNDVPALMDRIDCWLRGYQLPWDQQKSLLLKKYATKFPKTIKAIRERYLRYRFETSKAMVDMIDALLYWLPKELVNMSMDEIECHVLRRFASCTLGACDELNRLLRELGILDRPVEFLRTDVKQVTQAYSMTSFAIMAAAVVNDGVIAELGLIQKAVNNSRYAYLWLYVALHMFAALRSTDLIRLEVPALDLPAEEALRAISVGEFTPEEACKIEVAFESQVTAYQMHPHKTEHKGLSPILYVHCPESCKHMLGRILAIASAHMALSEDGNTIRVVNDHKTILEFFGDTFAAACDNKAFSGRRANKALMQATAAQAEESGVNPRVAYFFASRMRSHKGTYQDIAATTEVYLRDNSYKKLTTEEIVFLLMERGVCSFYVDALLRRVMGDRYHKASASEQNEIIKRIGLHPAEIDHIVRLTRRSMDQAVAVINDLVQASNPKKILLKIAVGTAHGKSLDSQCICKAASRPCKQPNRQNCLGCQYEILTKSLILKMQYAYNQLRDSADEGNDLDARRNRFCAESIYRPAVAELIAHLKGVGYDAQVYRQLLTGGEGSVSRTN